MNNKNEASQRESGSHRATFWLLFAMTACLWLGPPSSLNAESKVIDDQACTGAYSSGVTTDVDGAIAKITSVIQRNTKSWLCFHYRGALYNQKGDVNQAILDLSRAVELAPKGEVRPYELRQQFYRAVEQWDRALADCDVVLARKPKNAEFARYSASCLVGRAGCLLRLSRYSEALAATDEALKPQNKLDQSQRSWMYLWRGYSLLLLNGWSTTSTDHLAEAVESFDQSIALGKTDINNYFFRGYAEWRLGQFDKAKADAAMDLQLEPRLRMRYGGNHLLEMFNFDKRRAATQNAVDAAQAAEAKGDGPASFEAWNTAYWSCESYMPGPTGCPNILDGLLRSYPKLAAKPALPEAARQYMVQAETYFRDKDFAKAAEAYGKLISVAPWFPQAYFNRAFLEGEQQQYKPAVADMQMYLKLAPNAQDAREVQDQVYAWQAKTK